jgi:hypothetical protein
VPLGRDLDKVAEARAADAEEKKLAIDAGRGLDDAIEAVALAPVVTVLSFTLGAEMAFPVGGATLTLGTAPLADAEGANPQALAMAVSQFASVSVF